MTSKNRFMWDDADLVAPEDVEFEDEVEEDDPFVEAERLERGDVPGHPFRGNQWTDGEGGGAGPSRTLRAKTGTSTDDWGDFKEYSGVQRDWMLETKRKQTEFEQKGGPKGVRYDHAERGQPPDDDDVEKALTFLGGPIGSFLKEEGQEFPVPKEPPPIKLGTPKECFMNAAHLVIQGEDLYDYAEGYMISAGVPFPIHHAWAIDKETGSVVDPTVGWDPSARYIGIRMDKVQLSAQLLKNKVYGVFLDRRMAPTKILTKRTGYMKKGGA